MSVKRYLMAGIRVFPRDDGPWVTYDDHVAEVERLARERDEARAALTTLREAAERIVHLDTFDPPAGAVPTDAVYRQWDADWEAAVTRLAALAALPTPPEQEGT